jgi:hypothetical protein
MTTSDSRPQTLDPAHILCITHEATAGLRRSSVRAASTEDAIRMRFMSRRVARTAASALRRVGYQLSRVDGTDHRQLLVTGWSTTGLETRLATMRAVTHQLDLRPAAAAAAVIDRVRDLPESSAVPADAVVLAEAGRQLRAWVSARSGIHAPYDPDILPTDLGNRFRLQLTRLQEPTIDDLIEHQLKVGGHALSLFHSLRWHMTDDEAQAIAVRRADVTLHMHHPRRNRSLFSTAGTARPPGSELRLSWPDPAARPTRPARPNRLAASGFPRPARPGRSRGDVTHPSPTRPGERHFPASRPGPRR